MHRDAFCYFFNKNVQIDNSTAKYLLASVQIFYIDFARITTASNDLKVCPRGMGGDRPRRKRRNVLFVSVGDDRYMARDDAA